MRQILVRSLEKTFVVSVAEDADVKALKSAVEDVEYIPADLQRLSTGTTTLKAGLLSELLADEDTVTLNMDVNGGMRAKWRKKRMRRLRRKRRKMRQRAR